MAKLQSKGEGWLLILKSVGLGEAEKSGCWLARVWRLTPSQACDGHVSIPFLKQEWGFEHGAVQIKALNHLSYKVILVYG